MENALQGAEVLSLRLRGIVEAGFASVAEEELSDSISLNDFLIENKEASFLLRAQGDFMVEAGIFEGDLLVVERGAEAKPGSIVIVATEGGWAMKHFSESERLQVTAVVRAIIRKYAS